MSITWTTSLLGKKKGRKKITLPRTLIEINSRNLGGIFEQLKKKKKRGD